MTSTLKMPNAPRAHGGPPVVAGAPNLAGPPDPADTRDLTDAPNLAGAPDLADTPDLADAVDPAHAAKLAQAADIAAAVIGLVRQFSAIKARVSGPEGDNSPLFLLVKLVTNGPSRASDLAEQVGADPSTVSRQVAWLVKSGLVERRADPDDGRASILVPTEAGRARVTEHSQRRAQTMLPVIADWSEQDRTDLLRLVTKYTAGVDAHRERIISILLQHHEKENG